VASGLAVEVAKLVSRNFNRIAFLILVALPIVLFAVAVVAFGARLPFGQLAGLFSAIVGTLIGLLFTMRDLFDR
jgi:hypothetical protein